MKEGTILERLAENWLEGSFNRLLKPKLQPVQIAKAVAKEMEQGQMVGVDAPLAPNLYEVHLHPDDLADLAAFQLGLERELACFLSSRAAQRGIRFLASPRVKLVPEDQRPRRGRLRVRGTMVDLPPATPDTDGGEAIPWEGTAEMPMAVAVVEIALDDCSPAPDVREAALVDDSGRTIPLPATETSLGRAIDNDLVLEDTEVSRQHAKIVRELDRYVLLDLGSTNGSFVDGHRVTRHLLSDGEKLSFGGATFTFRLVDPPHP